MCRDAWNDEEDDEVERPQEKDVEQEDNIAENWFDREDDDRQNKSNVKTEKTAITTGAMATTGTLDITGTMATASCSGRSMITDNNSLHNTGFQEDYGAWTLPSNSSHKDDGSSDEEEEEEMLKLTQVC